MAHVRKREKEKNKDLTTGIILGAALGFFGNIASNFAWDVLEPYGFCRSLYGLFFTIVFAIYLYFLWKKF